MASPAISKMVRISRAFTAHRLSVQRYSSLDTPDYLETGKSKIPLYPCLNIRIKSYAYPVLENFQKYTCKLAENMDIDLENSWAYPPIVHKVQKFKPNTSIVIAEYEINEYQRNMQFPEVEATKYTIFLRTLEAALPEGVKLEIEYYDPAFEKKRYVPDTDLLQLKGELETMQRK